MERTYQRPYAEVFKKAKEAAKRLDWTIQNANYDRGLIEAASTASLLSWGETVAIKITALNQFNTKVSITSEAHSQLFSWGKDSTNEQNFHTALKQSLLG